MTALARYVARDVLRSQRWVAAALAFVVATIVVDSGGGPLLSTYAACATALLFAATWLTISIVNSEDPAQTPITAVTAGSWRRVQASKIVVALLAALLLAAAAVVVAPVLTGRTADPGDVGWGACALALTAATGVGFGAVCSRPLIRSRAWALLVAGSLCLAQVVIPDAPPVRQLLVRFGEQHPHDVASAVLVTAAETMVLAGVFLAVGIGLAGPRD
jgi:hypothetical protein